MPDQTPSEHQEIGGFFELEISPRRSVHEGMLALNSARNCLVYLIKARAIRTIHLPRYNCGVVEDAVRHFCPDVDIRHYHVDACFRPILRGVGRVECLYYVNYYGLNEPSNYMTLCYHLVVDNAQSFYAPALAGADSIYCPRKFVGVADGGYLCTDASGLVVQEQETSWPHATHLLRRLDTTASEAYADFQQADRSLRHRPLRRMSRLTERVLAGVDHERAMQKRAENFSMLHEHLQVSNVLSSIIAEAMDRPSFVPFCYPLLTREAASLRLALIRQKVYVPVYWPELLGSNLLSASERSLVDDILCLPIDQRYGVADMRTLLARLDEARRQ